VDCIECKAPSPDNNRFCGQCGAEVGRSLAETVKKGFRDRKSVEIEITQSVVGRLMKWATWLGSIVALVVALFAILLGKSYMDVHTTVKAGEAEIATSVLEGKKAIEPVLESARREVTEFHQTATGINQEYKDLQSDIGRYKQVNQSIEKLQKQFDAVQGQIVDLGERSLVAKTLEARGPGPSYFSFTRLGCPPPPEEKNFVAYCAQGSPLSLYQVTSAGGVRPVSGLSPSGFQDASTAPKPTCTAANRGTLYVEKGGVKVADKPFLCAKKSDNTYDWIQLGTAP
jgi:hypothetical protein